MHEVFFDRYPLAPFPIWGPVIFTATFMAPFVRPFLEAWSSFVGA